MYTYSLRNASFLGGLLYYVNMTYLSWIMLPSLSLVNFSCFQILKVSIQFLWTQQNSNKLYVRAFMLPQGMCSSTVRNRAVVLLEWIQSYTSQFLN